MIKKPYIIKPTPDKISRLAKSLYLLILMIILVVQKMDAENNHPAGARSRALSHAVISSSDTWATFHNQAGLAGVTTFTAGIFHESRFNIENLSLHAGSVILPTGMGSFGLSLYQFGSGAYKENKLGVAYAKRLSKKLLAGIQFDYFSHLFPENHKPIDLATFEAGIIYRITDKLHFASHVFNPFSIEFHYPSGRIALPAIFRTGGHYCFDKTVLITIEAEKQLKQPVRIKSGIEFIPIDQLALRLGISDYPFNYTGGLGYRFTKYSFDLGFGYHGNLGITPSMSVQFQL